LKTPRDFEGQVDKINEFITPGNEEGDQLIGVVGQFRLEDVMQPLRLP
jgi:hypothetical protein